MAVEHRLLLIGGAFALLLGMVVAALSIMAERKRQQRVLARLAGISGTSIDEAKSRKLTTPITRMEVTQEKGRYRRLMGIFGFDPAHSSHYPVPWAIVLVLSLLVARVVTGVLTILVGDLAFLAIPAIWVFLARAFFGWVDDRRRQLLRNQMPDALSMIVRSVRVGIPVSEAMRHVAKQSLPPTSLEFDRIASDLTIGTRLDASLKAMALRAGLPEYQFFATALTLQAQTGGGLTEMLENLADVIRKRVALRSKAYALASEARTSAMVLAALPFVSGLGLAVLSPSYIAILFVEESGRNLLGVAILSLSTGILAMRMIIRSSLK
ncbi:MAG: type II secretion system F family protein [Acetobacteraceae bacterium]|nr:type II secretion system F family protein [Acetobacteraceae bacterium]